MALGGLTPAELAAQLGVSGLRIRKWLRKHYPRSAAEKHGRWILDDDQIAGIRADFGSGSSPRSKQSAASAVGSGASKGQRGRQSEGKPKTRQGRRDEDYVIELCDQILGARARRQYRFDWLRGDPGKRGRGDTLPVDAYYGALGLVVEYQGIQHHEPVAPFDRRKETVSGVPRREQRRIYFRRREEEIPRHGLRLVVVRCDQLAWNGKRLMRDKSVDRAVLEGLLNSG